MGPVLGTGWGLVGNYAEALALPQDAQQFFCRGALEDSGPVSSRTAQECVHICAQMCDNTVGRQSSNEGPGHEVATSLHGRCAGFVVGLFRGSQSVGDNFSWGATYRFHGHGACCGVGMVCGPHGGGDDLTRGTVGGRKT